MGFQSKAVSRSIGKDVPATNYAYSRVLIWQICNTEEGVGLRDLVIANPPLMLTSLEYFRTQMDGGQPVALRPGDRHLIIWLEKLGYITYAEYWLILHYMDMRGESEPAREEIVDGPYDEYLNWDDQLHEGRSQRSSRTPGGWMSGWTAFSEFRDQRKIRVPRNRRFQSRNRRPFEPDWKVRKDKIRREAARNARKMNQGRDY